MLTVTQTTAASAIYYLIAQMRATAALVASDDD